MLISSTKEPRNYEEAVMHPSWVQAMKEELNTLEDNKTWSIKLNTKQMALVNATKFAW